MKPIIAITPEAVALSRTDGRGAFCRVAYSEALDAAIMFAPAGALVPPALHEGGTLVLAGIYMTLIPELQYEWHYHERVVRSVANATREDARQFMDLAGEIPLRTEVETFPLKDANRVLLALKRSEIHGAAVLIVGR